MARMTMFQRNASSACAIKRAPPAGERRAARAFINHMTIVAQHEPSLTEKLCFLSRPDVYPHAPETVSMIETHMSFVFLADARVYKLKKPVLYPFLDFSTLAAREHNCREEVRLNRRLAPDIYLGVVALGFSPVFGLSLSSPHTETTVTDWLVEMRRLPAERMLDQMIRHGAVEHRKIDDLCAVLARFYATAPRAPLSPQAYYARFLNEQAINRDVLTRSCFALDHDQTTTALDRLDALLHDSRDLFMMRVDQGAIVDGHGDLRPEHICLTEPIAIFDCLEFNPALRQVDPYDELAYLGVECAALGAQMIGDRILEVFMAQTPNPPPSRLIACYAAWHATLRARLSIAHLLEQTPRQPEKWEPQARRYLAIAAHHLENAK
jgi:aminoglycoside phosphotransferase family enzyme